MPEQLKTTEETTKTTEETAKTTPKRLTRRQQRELEAEIDRIIASPPNPLFPKSTATIREALAEMRRIDKERKRGRA